MTPTANASTAGTAQRILLAGVATIAGLLAGCAAADSADSNNPSSPALRVDDVARAFASYQQMTPKGLGVFVNPDLARLCIGATEQQVTEARKEHGPHAHTAVQIYMNDGAAGAYLGQTPYPVGAVVVKQKVILNYRVAGGKWAFDFRQERPNGVGGMIKRAPGYDSANGDWEYFYFEDPAKIETGHISSCVQCHASAKSTGYVFGTWKAKPQ